jgi:hypothetical protein
VLVGVLAVAALLLSVMLILTRLRHHNLEHQ